ncbi:hypothetical protein E4U41_001938 [Claviceps citrina]|nr:hypothetical protein E4U41_001938 [Claviceps citrina]
MQLRLVALQAGSIDFYRLTSRSVRCTRHMKLVLSGSKLRRSRGVWQAGGGEQWSAGDYPTQEVVMYEITGNFGWMRRSERREVRGRLNQWLMESWLNTGQLKRYSIMLK